MKNIWEYNRKTIEFYLEKELIDELNVLGQKGWEIIHYQETKPEKFGDKSKTFIIMKRIKTNML